MKRILYYIPKRFLIKFILFLLIMLFGRNVFALEYDVSNLITSPVGSGSALGTYTGEELNGSTGSFSINTRYQGTLQRIRYNISKPNAIDGDCFWTNMNYKITMNMATEDWRNRFGTVKVLPYSSYGTNWSSGRVTFVSYKKIYFSFKIPTSYTTCVQSVYVDLPSSALFTPFTGETNWNLKSIILSDDLSNSSGGSVGSSPSPTSSPDYSDITNNQNQNTQNIIDNNNSNTQDIIDNSNSNTQEVIDNVQDSIEQATQSIGNGLSSINSQLGTCFTNLLTFSNVNAHINTYLSNNNGYQIQSDTFSTPRYLKLQLYSLDNILIDDGLSNRPLLEVGRFNFPFTYTSDVAYLVFGINGQEVDTTFKLDLQTLDLFPNETYTLSFSVSNATNGDVTFTNFSLIKGNYVSRVVIPYKESVCTSKIDNFISQSQTNTQNIIDNNNSNTQDIIDNQDSNTQQIIENDKVCTIIDKSYGVLNRYLKQDGTLSGVDNSNYVVTDYINIFGADISSLSTGANTDRTCFYNQDKQVTGCIERVYEGNITIPLNSYYMRVSINTTTNKPTLKVCKSGNQSLNDSVNDLNDSITDETTPEIDLDIDLDTNSPVSSLLTMPLTILNKVFDITDDTCTPYTIPFDFTGGNNTLTFPCINLEDYLGTNVYNILDTILCFYICYEIGMMCISIYENMTSLRDGFDSLYTPQHAKPLGKHTSEVE